ncbi:DUF5776 domain-containing protein [Levilactobacillus lanxiensis]|uniref:DUF5776 domain-containing protein n=1 Tax=Levilactobacillus lanxiensis TaxID=2799568 RepID=A0ABW4D3Z1_9LACO|nr:DUF5776 domain-containing protein [Levilactobacillus lanxiensis]
MSKIARRLVLAGLTLTLIGGVFTPTLAQAATIEPDTSEATVSADSVHYQFNTIQSPYNIITDESGKTTNVPWYSPTADNPNIKQTFLSADILNTDSNFKTTFDAYDTADGNIGKVSDRMINLATNGLDGNPNQSLATALAATSPLNVSVADFITYESDLDFTYGWLFKSAAQTALKLRTQADIQAEYQKDIVPKLNEIDTINPDSNSDVKFDYYANDFPGQASGLLENADSIHLTKSPEQLAKLNLQASSDQEKALLMQPLKNFIVSQDGSDPANPTLLADGQLSTTAHPTCFVFGDSKPTTPSTPSVSNATSKPVTVHYVDEQGNTLKPDKTLTGSLGDTYQTEALNIDGYTLIKTTGQESGTYTNSDQSVTYAYRKAAAHAANVANVASKNSAIYATKKIRLYSSPTFTKQAVKTTYAKKSRMNRPMFKVIGTATSKNGVKRYQVQDLNGKGTTGYVTTRSSYVAPVYYANRPTKITVINPKGLNAYAKTSLTGKATHYKQGQVLKVKKIVTHNLTTRFVLSNGAYISANKKLVIAGKYTMPKRVQAKTAVNRYGTANLTNRNRHYPKKAHATFTVKGWAYSNANNFRKGDTLRYKVAGGYITGNKQFVRVIN